MLDLRLLDTSAVADAATRRALVEHALGGSGGSPLTRADTRRLTGLLADGDDHAWLLPLLTGHAAPWVRAVAAADPRVDGPQLARLLAADPSVAAFALEHVQHPDRITILVEALEIGTLANALDAVGEAADRLLEYRDAPASAWAAVLGKLGELARTDAAARLPGVTRIIASHAPADVVADALASHPVPLSEHLLEVFLQPLVAPAPLVAAVAETLTRTGDGPDVAYVTCLLSPTLDPRHRSALRDAAGSHSAHRATALFARSAAPAGTDPVSAAVTALAGCRNPHTLTAWADLPPLPDPVELALAGNSHLTVGVLAARATTLPDTHLVDAVLTLRSDPELTARVYIGACDLVADRHLDVATCAKLADLKAAGTLVPPRRRSRPGGWVDALEELTGDDLGTFTCRAAATAALASPHCAALLAGLLGSGRTSGFFATLELLGRGAAVTVAEAAAAAAAASLPASAG